MIELQQSSFSQATGAAYRALPRGKPDNPMLAQLKLVYKDGMLGIYGTNNVTSIAAYIGAKGEFSGVTVEGRMLGSLAKQMQASTVTLANERNNLLVECGHLKASLPTTDIRKFPIAPRPEKWIDTGIHQFSKALKQVGFCVQKDIAERALEGVHFRTYNGYLELAATDKFRLSVKRIPIERALPIESAIVPSGSIQKLTRLSSDDLYVGETGNTLAFKTGNIILNTQLINAQYPPIERFYRDEWNTRIVVPVAKLKHAVSAANAVMQYLDGLVKVKAENNSLKFEGRTMERGTVKSQAECTIKGQDIEFLIDGTFFESILQACETELVGVELESPVKPILIKPYNDETHWMLSMPLSPR